MSNNNELKNTHFFAKCTGEECDIPHLKNKITQLSDIVCINGIYYENNKTMSNNKQTAVEWLVVELNQELNYIPITQWDRIKDLIQRAKVMHKQELLNIFNCGRNFQATGEGTFNEIYNEKYGS